VSTAIDIPQYADSLVLRPVKGNTPFGYYDNDPLFISDTQKFANYAYRKLGGIMEDVELQDLHYYTAMEDAVTTFGKELYEYKIRENYLSLEGAPTGSRSLNNTVIQPNLGTIVRLSQDYGTEAGTGGNVTWYTGSLKATPYVQTYDLNEWAMSSSVVLPGDAIEIKRVYYEIPPAVTRFFDPTVASGIGYESLLNSFGFDRMSPAVNYMMMPVYFDILRVQSIEFNDIVRRSAYTFEMTNNILKIFPIPCWDREIRFEFIKLSERNLPYRSVGGVVPQGNITNVSNVPYEVPVYSQVNMIFRKWIFEYGVAVCREILAGIRGKYQTVPIPGNDSSVTLNGDALRQQSDADKDKLITQLRDTLNSSSRQKQLEMKALEAQSMNQIENYVPMMIYVG
jgi:hypothetical protein